MKKKGIIIINKDFSADWLPLLKKMGINAVGLHSLYQFGGLQAYLEWLQEEKTQTLIALFERNGIIVEHQLHAVDWLLPRALFAEHPLWFRENAQGERVNDWNLCSTNEDALAYISDSAYRLAQLLKQKTHDYYIWCDDCVDTICHCEKCRQYNGADQNMLIMRAVLSGLKRYDRNARLSFLSYQDSFLLPTLKPSKDIFLEFAPIGRSHTVPLDSADEENQKNCKMLEDLLKIFPAETTQILEYFLDVSLYCKWDRSLAGALPLDREVLERDIAYYKGLGVDGITTFAGFIDNAWRAQFGDDSLLLYGEILNKA